MSIIELNASLFWEIFPCKNSSSLLRVSFMPTQDVLDCRWNQQILLLKTKFFSSISGIIRIQHTCDILCALPGLKGIVVLSSIEGKQIELI